MPESKNNYIISDSNVNLGDKNSVNVSSSLSKEELEHYIEKKDKQVDELIKIIKHFVLGVGED